MSVVCLDDRWMTSRKSHRCNVCEGTIGAGERYRRQRLIGDDPYVFKAHALCDAAYWKVYRGLDWVDEDEGLHPDEVVPVVASFFATLAGMGLGASA